MTTIDSRITAIAQAITDLTASVRAGKPLSKEDALALIECRTQFDTIKQVDTFVEVKAGSKLMTICDKWGAPTVNDVVSDNDPAVYCAYVQCASDNGRLYWVNADKPYSKCIEEATLMARTPARRAMDDLVLRYRITGLYRNSTGSEAINQLPGSVEIGVMRKDLFPEVSTVLSPITPKEM